MLRIAVDEDRHVSDADLGIEVRRGKLRVPAEVGRILERMRVVNADQLAATLRSFPSAFIAELHWSSSDFEQACARAIEQLRGHVDARLLEESGTFERGFGALPPKKP